ncbi:hypothetical protein KFL_000190270 [Klebsormidium nitens]|uniref:BACK domain-containing protein n=1 Tax=Klebsormidium nitens TaxID=105231 RepID=A0A1Y1HSK8_KLENI|nr:hypothetical protein KFL_000190270 [Klebsormidium nitens]|eukprot:GAQ78808.1 hypothetical protein KFL_000190270 [Klebsormidium nitens]
MGAVLGAQRRQQLGEAHSVEAGDTVHLTFGFRSELTQFSDRVIRVHVEGEAEGEASEDCKDFQQARCWHLGGRKHADCKTRPASGAVENEQFVDLEMQSGEGRATGASTLARSYDIPVNGLILAALSQCFRTMLTSGLHESKSKEQPLEVTLSPQVRLHAPNSARNLRGQGGALLAAHFADRFEAPACIHSCVKTLTSSPTTLNDAVVYLNLPEAVKRHEALRVLMDAVSALTGWSFEEVAACESILTMKESSMKRLVSRLRDSEGDVETSFNLILHWFRFGGQKRWGALERLLSILGFWRMSLSFLRNDVESCPELRTEEGRALVEKVKALKDPRVIEATAACQAEPAAPQGAAVQVAGAPAAAPAGLAVALNHGKRVSTWGAWLGLLVGCALPFVFLLLAIYCHQEAYTIIFVVLLGFTTWGCLPYAGWRLGGSIGKWIAKRL